MRLRHTWELTSVERTVLHGFLVDAFDGDFEPTDFDHCLGGVHVLAEDDDGIVGHASVVQRQLTADGVVHRTGYVEAVAVAARMRRRGIGDALMSRVDDIVRGAYELGALGASDDGMPLYLRRGWELWRGRLAVLGVDGVVPTPDDEGAVLVLRTDFTADLDLSSLLICEPRIGDVW